MKDILGTVKIPLFVWLEDHQVVAYTPALDLSTCGASEKEAVRNFQEAAELFIETAVERDVLRETLESLGWTFQHDVWNPHREALSSSQALEIQVPIPKVA